MKLISKKVSEGKILFIEDTCYLRIGFEGNDGKSETKIIKANELIDFLGELINEDDCFRITEEHKKMNNIIMLDKCKISKKPKLKELDITKKWK